MSVLAHIGLGSNLGDPVRQIERALIELAHLPATTLVAASSRYASAPVGCSIPQLEYVNAVVALRTALSPRRLLHAMQRIERRHRRRRGARNAPRTLDLDLLLYGRLRFRRRGLTVPHPRLHRRAFVLRPLLELAPATRIAGRGSARRFLSAVRGQAVRRVG